ncbi:MAG TPA: GNAT family N-acetyltransferase [Aggregatilinea sp.]|uniref:GNAT family N-acetyltransferase n=1 Tax=Aggregatilinea sp. TaxID=2806333 RepID=UPI002C43859F|nr:GNAT family N-acetyltransferase [Aggregatilinea sp.]HML22825.1 GNAT family N-acetyltransferase [Aggregatilinea sp.]
MSEDASSPPLIRPMRAEDVPAVCELIGQLTGYVPTEEAMLDKLAWVECSAVDWVYVAEVDGVPCGFMGFRLREMLERPGRYGEISALVTDARVRRHGVGRALVAYAEDLAREHGCVGTWLVSGFGRKDEAHRFYDALGYATTGYRFVKRFDED